MKEKKNSGFGKILLGITIAAGAMIAYKKIPAVKNVVDKGIDAGKKLIGKAGNALSKAGNQKEAAPAPAEQPAK